ncbi:uncharacterized protein LOC100901058 [Galendromus occidentalis]|uniref:Uncharacterized protein LOC100901058 n=1 Tax=Galendromus occidentalis TaxID=34638 RepID=A0AAJ7L3R8_9ACAR|nr:uncharacterized protein LOC100901058 [Galendromus occidentalis]
MPKSKMSPSALVSVFGVDIFSNDGNVILCKLCVKSFTEPTKFRIGQHIATKNHKDAVERSVRAFMNADIPLHKLSNAALKDFLEKYSSMKVPDQSTLRKNYAPLIHARVIDGIRQEIGSCKIYVSIDETTDSAGRSIANIVVGKLERTHLGKGHLLMCELLERCNATSIAQIFVKSMEFVWPEGVQHDRVLLFVTDAARYMVKAAKSLKILFPRLIHLTCIAHGLHRVAEEARTLFPKVDRLIASMKMVLLKSPCRIALFRERVELPLPPKPVLTRWGSWIKTAEYYAENFEILRNFVLEDLDEKDAGSIKEAKNLFLDETIRANLVAIASNLSDIPHCITALEEYGLSLERHSAPRKISQRLSCGLTPDLNAQ